MRKLAAWILAIGLAASPAAMAANGSGDDKTTDGATKTAPSDTSKTDKTTDKTSKTDATPHSSAELAAEIDQLRAMLKEQADQLEEQRQELAAMKAGLSHDASAASNSTAPSSTSSTTSAANALSITPAGSAPVATASNAATAPLANPAAAAVPAGPVPGSPQQMNATEHSPLSFKIGDAQFTPGGFMDFTSVFRSTGTGNGIGTTFNTIPYINNGGTNPTAGLSELRFSVQNSRIALRVDAPVGEAKIAGYVEADFLGAIAANANVTSNSDSLRMRLYFADYRRGPWEFLGGQDWSMLTPNRKGIGVFPNDIFYSQDMDTNYQAGLVWARQPQFRVMYHPNDDWTFGVSIENPDQLVGTAVVAPAAFSPFTGTVDETSGGTLSTPPTPNYVPDIILKVANDSHVGDKLFHVEAAGLFTEFKLFTPASITTTTSATRTATGGGVSVNANLELFKNFRLIANSFYSDGGGRYIFGMGPDLAIKQASTTAPFVPSPVHSASGIGGFEYQATKSSLFDVYYGAAYYGRDVILNPVGGLPNLGYGFSGSANTNNRAIQEYTVGWTQTFWQNPNFGKLQLITQGSYLTRAPWFLATTSTPPDAHLFMVYLDLRYVLP
jgi:hypothetical protein